MVRTKTAFAPRVRHKIESPAANPEVCGLLLTGVEETSRVHSVAREYFWKIAGQPGELPGIPAGQPHPDESEMIRNALIRLNRYLVDGTILKDLPRKVRTVQAVG